VSDFDCVLVLTTLPVEADAVGFATTLVEERLAACVNVKGAMVSVYRWKDAVAQDEERQIVIKTTARRLEDLWVRLRQLHPYDVPEFVVLPVAEGSDAYLAWVRDSTAAP
jgi:periplasmic divalent cation tolerance protein